MHPESSNTLYPVLLGTGGDSKPFSQETALCSHDVNNTIYITFEQAPLAEKIFFLNPFPVFIVMTGLVVNEENVKELNLTQTCLPIFLHVCF